MKSRPPLSTRPAWQQWVLLLVLSLVLLALFELTRIPAALMLGPMFGGIVVGVGGGSIRMPSNIFKGGQAIIGCMIAAALSPHVVAYFIHDWWIFLLVILLAVALSSVLGYLLTRLHVMPGATAVWGTTPGAASTMVIMAEEYGSDARLVAFMQYLRVLLVAVLASVVAMVVVPDMTSHSLPAAWEIDWFPAVVPLALASTLAIALAGCVAANLLHIPAANMLGPMALGGVLHSLGWVDMQLPQWLLAMSYAILGWKIGLSFDAKSLRYAYKALPAVTLTMLVLIAFCGLLAWMLVLTFKIDPLTAYLATSPGGLDTVAIIAASRPYVNMTFVITMQTARLLILAVLCPPLARYLSKLSARKDAQKGS